MNIWGLLRILKVGLIMYLAGTFGGNAVKKQTFQFSIKCFKLVLIQFDI